MPTRTYPDLNGLSGDQGGESGNDDRPWVMSEWFCLDHYNNMQKFTSVAKVGDLIEIERGEFQHWAVYGGKKCLEDNRVDAASVYHRINLDWKTLLNVSNSSGPRFSSVRQQEQNRRENRDHKLGDICLELLSDVVGDNKWRINNSLDNKEGFTPERTEVIIRRAKQALQDPRLFGEYSEINNNCEHFATRCRYGKAVSIQSTEVKTAAVVTGVLALGATALGGLFFGTAVGLGAGYLFIKNKLDKGKLQRK